MCKRGYGFPLKSPTSPKHSPVSLPKSHMCILTRGAKIKGAHAKELSITAIDPSFTTKEPCIPATKHIFFGRARVCTLTTCDETTSARAREPYDTVEEPCITVNKPYITTDEPCIFSKQPCVSAKEQ